MRPPELPTAHPGRTRERETVVVPGTVTAAKDIGARHERIASRLERWGALELADRVARSHRATLEELLSGVRWTNVAAARRELWSLLHHTLNFGWSELGRAFEVDHSTVLYAVRQRERELAESVEPPRPRPVALGLVKARAAGSRRGGPK